MRSIDVNLGRAMRLDTGPGTACEGNGKLATENNNITS